MLEKLQLKHKKASKREAIIWRGAVKIRAWLNTNRDPKPNCSPGPPSKATSILFVQNLQLPIKDVASLLCACVEFISRSFFTLINRVCLVPSIFLCITPLYDRHYLASQAKVRHRPLNFWNAFLASFAADDHDNHSQEDCEEEEDADDP